jgi:hypothetical protein
VVTVGCAVWFDGGVYGGGRKQDLQGTAAVATDLCPPNTLTDDESANGVDTAQRMPHYSENSHAQDWSRSISLYPRCDRHP